MAKMNVQPTKKHKLRYKCTKPSEIRTHSADSLYFIRASAYHTKPHTIQITHTLTIHV